MKPWERITEARLREIVNVRDNQFGFRPGMSTTEPVFALRQLQEKARERNTDLHMVFEDLEKAFDRIPRDLIWRCLRNCTGHVQVNQQASSYRERLNWIFPNRGGITPRISPESSLVHHNNGRSNGKHREGSTLGDDVRCVL